MRSSSVYLAALVAGFSVSVGCATRDFTKGEPNVCEMHHRKMEKAVVPIQYGLFAITPRRSALYSASTNAFPHAEKYVNPGCIVRRQRNAVVYACADCVKARDAWEIAYDSAH